MSETKTSPLSENLKSYYNDTKTWIGGAIDRFDELTWIEKMVLVTIVHLSVRFLNKKKKKDSNDD